MLGMRRNVFNSSRKRPWLSRTNASVVVDMNSKTIIYTSSSPCGRAGLPLPSPRPDARQHPPHLGLVERLRQQVIRAQIDGFGPETGVGPGIGDDQLGAAFTRKMQHIPPGSIFQLGFGQYDPEQAGFQLDGCDVQADRVNY